MSSPRRVSMLVELTRNKVKFKVWDRGGEGTTWRMVIDMCSPNGAEYAAAEAAMKREAWRRAQG